jgi:hypothetical protein
MNYDIFVCVQEPTNHSSSKQRFGRFMVGAERVSVPNAGEVVGDAWY